jgi:type 1 fimbriae regulatory protein FimB/type 1 fimbriae regulatory protein FimE
MTAPVQWRITRRSNGQWVLNVHFDDGKRSQLYCDSKKHAEQRLAELMRSPEPQTPRRRRQGYTVADAMPYLEAHFEGMRSERSSLIYAREVAEFFGMGTPVQEITANDVEKLVEHLKRKDNAASTIKNKLCKLNLMREAAIKQGGVMSLPPLAKQRLTADNIQERIWAPDELRMVCDNLRRRGHHQEEALVVFMVEMGPRFSECERVLGKHVDLKKGTVQFFKAKKDNKEGNRVLRMTPRAIDAITPYLPPSDRLRVWNITYDAFNWQIERAMEMCGIDIPRPIHQLRHTCGTRMGMAGRTTLQIAAWLGHRGTKTCERYIHMDTSRLDDCYEALVASSSSW